MLFKKSEKQDVEATETVETPEPLAHMDSTTLLELTDEKRDELAVALYHISNSLFMNAEELDKVIEFLGIDITDARYMCKLLDIDHEQWNFQQNHRKK
ncbi:hypothetical protein [Lactococcus garvieae]|uniref:hypothetical protein n=1 Tax=Lactococcus garvieae TaxID=1363 RepID=UPI00254E7E73|nr:hypothetical protein [Lactococcus garvieae]